MIAKFVKVALVSLVIVLVPSAEAAPPQKLQLKEQVVRLVLKRHDSVRMKKGGSAVFLSKDGWMATAAHCVKPSHDLFVVTSNGQVHAVEVHHVNRHLDFAILRVKDPSKLSKAIIDIKFRQVQRGESVAAAGFPQWASTLQMRQGAVVSFTPTPGGRMIRSNVDIYHGSSGGGLFTMNGELAGITVWGHAGVVDAHKGCPMYKESSSGPAMAVRKAFLKERKKFEQRKTEQEKLNEILPERLKVAA